MRHVHRFIVVIAACAALAPGCQKKPETAAPPAASPPSAAQALGGLFAPPGAASGPELGPPHPQAGLNVTVDGRPAAMQTALAVQRGGKIELTFSSVPLACAALMGNGRALAPDEVTFSVTLGRKLARDGSFAWGVAETYFAGSTMAGTGANTAEVSAADAAVDAHTALRLHVEAESFEGRDRPRRKLVADGTVDAVGCGPKPDEPAAAGPPPAPQEGAIAVAGQSFPVVGASLVAQGGERTLTLSSGTVGCDGNGPADARVVLTWRGEPPALWQVQLDGDLIDGTKLTQILGDTPPTATFTEAGAEAPVGVVLGGGAVDCVGWPVQLSGTVNAIRCAH